VAPLVGSAGAILGAYLETIHARKIERRSQLTIKLVSTKSQNILWEDTVDIHVNEHIVMFGRNKNEKSKLAVLSFRDAVNEMVKRLANSELATTK